MLTSPIVVHISELDSDYDPVEICTNLKLDISPDKVICACIPHNNGLFIIFVDIRYITTSLFVARS